MSEEKLSRAAKRWIEQARDDLEAAEALLKVDQYPQAAFLAQQTAQKAMKAVWILLDLDPWGHSVARLIKDLPESTKPVFEEKLDDALSLDKLYIPTRYPDALGELTPSEAYTEREARRAVDEASGFVEQVGEWLDNQ